MTDKQQRDAAKKFADEWKGKGDEKQQSQTFWLSLLHDVYGVDDLASFIRFEDKVHLDHTSFIDGYIPATKVMIEQKSIGKDLNKPIKQSDGSLLSPFQQAKRYIVELPVDQHPRWVITCNFEEFWIYDMNKPQGEPEKVRLADLPKEYYRLQFLVESGNAHLQREMEISVAAGEIVGLLYDAFAKQYKNFAEGHAMRSLNILCVRLVFCLYAEDAGIFGKRGMFHDYLAAFDTRRTRRALIDLFKILDTPEDRRDPYLRDENPALAAFPYVNGGLFSEEDIEIPTFTDEIRSLLLSKASDDFDWSEISPTIFGAVFESTLNPETRRSGGMHYTSIENIHKVIDPLFLDGLKKELAAILTITAAPDRKKKLKAFQAKLGSLTFLDPAAGSGNFLTETYLSLRKLENEVISELAGGQITIADTNVYSPILVNIGQFYGIEINDFAVSVAKTALWIAESQMMKETEGIIKMPLDFLPLTTNASIHEANALRVDWAQVIPPEKLNYIMGNPPFVGYYLQTQEQKKDIASIFVDESGKPYKTMGKNDYVSGWYFKAAALMQGTNARAAFVSTNSITQGEQARGVWKPLFDRFKIHIDFAYRTFRWDSEASLKAHVHCVIVGFSAAPNPVPRLLFDGERFQEAGNINAYLIDGDDIFIESRKKPICDVPEMLLGSFPVDGGFLVMTEEEKEQLLKDEPQALPLIRPYMMGNDFIKRKPRWCLWLVNASPSLLKKCPKILKRIEKVRDFRLASPKVATRKKAETPMLFADARECQNDYVAVPRVSSEQRRYIPMEYLPPKIMPGDTLYMIPDATLYHFGVLTSNVHMGWMRATCGRLKSDYRYSKDVVYNNFPWPEPTDEQKAKIERTAQGILDARAQFPDSSLADLYDELTMPPGLRTAHQVNDRAVMEAYGFPVKTTTESSCVAALMKLYRLMTEKK